MLFDARGCSLPRAPFLFMGSKIIVLITQGALDTMSRFAWMLVFAGSTMPALAAEPSSATLACVSSEACGCSLIVMGERCSVGESHFFHDLVDGAPLQFNLGQGLLRAVSSRPQADFFSPGPGSSWSESYDYGGGKIEIHYTPAPSTCMKSADDEPCEYFDVHARIVLSNRQGIHRYEGHGKCGC